jgi:glutamate synthase (NADPH/NADH) large chain/glutamate synthase (ferredoxin)
LQSIKHTGMPWELGLAEAQQVLVKNGLRQRVKVRADGGFKTGRDVVVAAMLGAEEYGFGTAALVSLGCDMARQCHLNTCPAGIATQREDLRAKFTGRSQHLVNYLTLVAEEVRTFLAQLGIRSMDELIGRADLLEVSEDAELDLQPLLAPMPVKFVPGQEAKYSAAWVSEQLVADAQPALEGQQSVLLQYQIHNDDRAVGVRLAGAIAERYGNAGLPGVSVTASFQGVAGQSFGAFAVSGMRFFLHGAANDYMAKGMTGGQIVVTPPASAQYASQENTIAGNTVLYGATGGELFVAGRAGERFAVRNSGAVAVVEGLGDHGCEYMTGGMVVVLGETGKNFAAGMSSGVAYVLDVQRQFPSRCNTELVQIERVFEQEELQGLWQLIARHARKTHSKYAEDLLQRWSEVAPYFWRVRQLGGSLNVTNFIPQADYDEVSSARALS